MITIGGVQLVDPSDISMSGDVLELRTEVSGSSVDDAVLKRFQLLGLQDNPWEWFVPVTWTEDPSIDGFYVVEEVRVGSRPTSLVTGWHPVDLRLGRLTKGSVARLECVTRGAVRQNFGPGASSVSSAESQPWLAIPAGWNVGVPGAVRSTRPGTVESVTIVVPADQMLYDAQLEGLTSPADWYRNAATVVDVTNTRVVGRVSRLEPRGVRNGLIDAQFAGSMGALWVRPTKPGGGTGTQREWLLGWWGTAFEHRITPGSRRAVRVIANSPAYASVQALFDVEVSSGVREVVSVTLGLRRGSPLVSLTFAAQTARKFAVMSDDSAAVTALNAGGGSDQVGMRASSIDSDGNRFMAITSWLHTIDFTNQALASDVASVSRDFAVGYEIGGDSAASPDTAPDLANQWMASLTETWRVIR